MQHFYRLSCCFSCSSASCYSIYPLVAFGFLVILPNISCSQQDDSVHSNRNHSMDKIEDQCNSNINHPQNIHIYETKMISALQITIQVTFAYIYKYMQRNKYFGPNGIFQLAPIIATKSPLSLLFCMLFVVLYEIFVLFWYNHT